jgi:hypothetical protein
MREIKKLNTEQSISKRRLVFDEGWLDKFNRLAVYIVFSPFIFLPVIMSFKENFVSPNDRFILSYVFPVSIAFGLYIFYRNATEKRLIKIKTSMDRQTIRKMLLGYADKNQLEIYRKSNDCLIFNESFDSWTLAYKKTRIFFVQDNLVLFTVIRDNFNLNMPTLFTHLFLKHDLTKIFRKSNN